MSRLRIILFWLGGGLLSLIVVISVLLFWLTSVSGERYTASLLENMLQSNLRLETEIGLLKTNLFSSLTLKNIHLASPASEDTTRLTIDQIDVAYDLSSLLSKQINILSVLIDQASVELRTDSSGAWLLGNLLEETDSTTSSSWVVELEQLEIRSAECSVQDRHSGLAIALDSLDMTLRSQEGVFALELSGVWPLLESKAAPGRILVRGELSAARTTFSQIQLLLSEFSLEGTADIDMTTPDWLLESSIMLSGSPAQLLPSLANIAGTDLPTTTGTMDMSLHLSGPVEDPLVAFSCMLQDFGVDTYPRVNGSLSGAVNSEHVRLDTLDLRILETPFQAHGDLAFDSLLSFSLSGQIPAFPIEQSLSKFYQSDHEYQGLIQGNFVGEGQLLALEHINLNAEFKIRRAFWQGKPIQQTDLAIRVSEKRAHLTFEQNLNSIKASASLDSIEDLAATLQFNLPDLAPIVPYTPLVGLSGSISGSAFLNRSLGSYHYSADLLATNLEYKDLLVDGIAIKLKGVDDNWRIDQSQIDASRIDLAALNHFIDTPVIKGQAAVKAAVRGNQSELSGTAQVFITELRVDTLYVDSTRLNLTLAQQQVSINSAHVWWSEQRVSAQGSADWVKRNANFSLKAARKTQESWIQQGSLSGMVSDAGKGITAKLQVQNMDLALLELVLPDLGPVEGRIQALATINMGSAFESGSLHLSAEDLAWSGQRLDHVRLAGSLDSRYLTLDTLRIDSREETIFVQASLPIDLDTRMIREKAGLSGRLSIDKLELRRGNAYLPEGISLTGKLNTALAITGNWTEPRFNGQLGLDTVSVQYPDFPLFYIDTLFADLQGQRVYLRNLACRLGLYPLHLTGQADLFDRDNYALKLLMNKGSEGRADVSLRSENKVLAARVKLQSLDLGLVTFFLEPGQEVRGRLDGNLNVGDLTGTPQLKGQFSIDSGYLRLGQDIPSIQDIAIDINLIPDRITLGKIAGNLDMHPFLIKGYIKHENWQTFHIKSELEVSAIKSLSLSGDVSPVDLNLNMLIPTMNLAIWQPLLPVNSGLSGQLKGSLNLSGSLELPDMRGEILAQNLAIKLPYLDPGLSGGSLSAHFKGTSIHLDSLAFKQGKNGRIVVKGNVEYLPDVRPALNIVMELDQLKLKEANVVKAEVDRARIRYSGRSEKYVLQGELKLGTSVFQKRFTPQEILKLVTSSSIATSSPNALLSKSTINLKIRESDQISIHNNLAHIRLKPDLTIIGTLANPIPTGRVKIEEGYILYLDRRFSVTSGTLDFQDPYQINPIVDFHAKCQLKPFQTQSKKEYLIYIDISGPADAVQVNLHSEPALDRTDILTLLTMGATRQELSQSDPNLDNAKLTKMLQDRLADYSSQKISAYTADRLGTIMNLESISIEGDLFNFGSSWGPQLVASKKLGEKTTLTYSTSVGRATDQNVKLEYEIKEGISVEGQTDQQGRSGLDLKFGFKFK